MSNVAGLDDVRREAIECRACPRLVGWREQVAVEKRASFRDQEYWGRPVPGFGDPGASIMVVGLAPAAHGGNRTGRIFTGDRSGDWLFASLHRCGLANQAESTSVDDGLQLSDVYITAAVKCAPPANKPTPAERDECVGRFLRREVDLLDLVDRRVMVCLGKFAFDVVCDVLGIRPRPRFGHGAEVAIPSGGVLLGCFHPSQQNTFTGKLTEPMLDAVFLRAKELAGDGSVELPERGESCRNGG
jgi:uracil-DNA glycosylase family 4